MVPQHSPRQLSNGLEHPTIAVCSQVDEGVDCPLNLLIFYAATQYILSETEVAIAADTEYKPQASGETIRVDTQED